MAETAYEQDSREGAEARKDLPRIPAGHFRVHMKKGTSTNPFPFKDVLNEQTLSRFFETKVQEGSGLRIVQNVERILAKDHYAAKAKGLLSKIFSIEDRPGKSGRPTNEEKAAAEATNEEKAAAEASK